MASSKKLSPDTLTERWLRGLGWDVGQCWRQTGNIKRDLFGIADQFAFAGGLHVLVQTTTVNHFAAHRVKLLASDLSTAWKRAYAGNLIYLIGWHDRTGDRVPRVEAIQWDPVKAVLVAVPIQDPVLELDVQDPQGLARARKNMIKQFFLNALDSWATSALGLVLGGPEIYAGLQGVLDTDPATTVDWKVLAVGVGILFMGMITRDWTKGLFKSERNPEIK